VGAVRPPGFPAATDNQRRKKRREAAMMDSPSDSASGTPRDGKNVVQVQILGQQLPLRTEADPKYAIELAEFVDQKMREVTKMLPVASVSKVAILASLNIADELFKERANKQRTGSDFQDKAAVIARRLDEILDEVR
jgi:cell division protein ZapA